MPNIDRNQLFPNQFLDNDPTECAGITVADIVGNIVGTVMSPDYSYAAGFNVRGDTPSTGGEDPGAAVDGAVALGCLPASDETFTALTSGEQFVMNYANYSSSQDKDALKYVQNGIQRLYSFDEIYNWLKQGKSGVILPLKWYQSFNAPDPQGFLPQPGGRFSYHCTAAYDPGEDPVKGRYIEDKSWQGKNYGIGGYVKITEDIFNKSFTSPAYRFDPEASRWVSLLFIIARRFPWFLAYVPAIIMNNFKKKV